MIRLKSDDAVRLQLSCVSVLHNNCTDDADFTGEVFAGSQLGFRKLISEVNECPFKQVARLSRLFYFI